MKIDSLPNIILKSLLEFVSHQHEHFCLNRPILNAPDLQMLLDQEVQVGNTT